MDGVIDLGRPENLSRRRYRVLRIPKQVVERYLTTKSGRTVTVEVPERAEPFVPQSQWHEILWLTKKNDLKRFPRGNRYVIDHARRRLRPDFPSNSVDKQLKHAIVAAFI
jgi:hypothetical protein